MSLSFSARAGVCVVQVLTLAAGLGMGAQACYMRTPLPASPIEEKLSSPDAAVRAMGVRELAHSPDPAAREALRRMWAWETDPIVVAEIDRALVPNVHVPRDRVAAVLAPLEAGCNPEGPSLIDAQWHELHELGFDPVEVLIAIADDPNETVRIRANAIAWIARFPSPAGLAFLETRLRMEDPEPALLGAAISAYAVAFFGQYRAWEHAPSPGSFGSSQFDRFGPYQRAFGPRTDTIRAEFLRLLAHPSGVVRAAAAWGLGFVRSPEVLAALADALRREHDQRARETMTDSGQHHPLDL